MYDTDATILKKHVYLFN